MVAVVCVNHPVCEGHGLMKYHQNTTIIKIHSSVYRFNKDNTTTFLLCLSLFAAANAGNTPNKQQLKER